MQFVSRIRQSIRSLSRQRAFSLAIITITALGVGANAAVFAVVYQVLLRQLPFQHPEQLVIVTEAATFDTGLVSVMSEPNERIPGSNDMGKTWTYSASPFQPIGGSQRAVLMRLREGPLLFISFGGEKVWDSSRRTAITKSGGKDMMITDASGAERPLSGIFAALPFDEGETWPARRLISDDAPDREVETSDRRTFIMGKSSAETFSYLSALWFNKQRATVLISPSITCGGIYAGVTLPLAQAPD